MITMIIHHLLRRFSMGVLNGMTESPCIRIVSCDRMSTNVACIGGGFFLMILHVVFLPVCQKEKLIQSDEHVFHFCVAEKEHQLSH